MSLDSYTSSEVLFVINQLPTSYKKKIPDDILLELQSNYSKEHYDSFIPDKPFFKQDISEESLSFLNDLFDNYLL